MMKSRRRMEAFALCPPKFNRHSPDARRDEGDGRLLTFHWQQNSSATSPMTSERRIAHLVLLEPADFPHRLGSPTGTL
jgi:hypothetical protein